MNPRKFSARSDLDVPVRDLWDWHLRSGAFDRLNPPWQPVEVVNRGNGVAEESRIVLRVPLGPFGRTWVVRHHGLDEGRAFHDQQLAGPFARWEHAHRFAERGERASTLEDAIEYALPGGALGNLLGGPVVRGKLRRLFAWRHAVTRADLRRHAAGPAPMTVAVSGAGGLVGSALCAFLTTGGHEVRRLVRRPTTDEREIFWDPAAGEIDAAGLEGVDAVVHLAGKSIASGRWTDERKCRIRDSRVRGTGLIAETLARLERPPRVLVSASALGYYGDRGDERLDESSARGTGFLADVCEAWEDATAAAERAGIRVVRLRIGIVLAAGGGALARMLLPFRLGFGGPVGGGRQFMSWIALDDLVGAIHHALATDGLAGPVNAVAPTPVRNAELARELGRVLRRPAVLPTPAFALRLALGEMADELLLASGRIEPRRLEETGFRFVHPELEGALRFELGRLDPVGAGVAIAD